MTDLPDIKLKAQVAFPATILDGVGIDTVKRDGNYQFNLAFDDFAPPVSSVTDPANQNALLWNAVTNQYVLAPVSVLSTTVSPSTAIPLPDATPGLPGGSLNYARGDHVHPTDTSRAALTQVVRYDAAQALTAAQQVQARQNIYAAPFDAMAYNGMQVNGSMEVSQENGASVITVANQVRYLADGWFVYSAGSQSMAAAQVAATGLTGLINCISAGVSTANAAPAAGDQVILNHRIEGYRTERLAWGSAAAQSVTLAFWVFAVRPGNYSGSIQNGTPNRSYVFTFPVSAASTWEYKTLTIPGDTTGTWNVNNTTGLQITFAIMAGSSLCTAPNVWTAGDFRGATGTINGVAATSDTFRITGVVILPGIEAPSAARSALIMRSYDQELLTCKRYFEIIGGFADNSVLFQSVATAAGQTFSWVLPYMPKRAAPTVTMNGAWFVLNCSQPVIAAANLYSLTAQITSSGAGQMQCNGNSSDDLFKVDIRL